MLSFFVAKTTLPRLKSRMIFSSDPKEWQISWHVTKHGLDAGHGRWTWTLDSGQVTTQLTTHIVFADAQSILSVVGSTTVF
jgi:hypothetical protein